MPELSNLLRQRLEAGESVPSPVHPDADTLTAYVEQLLPARERNSVVSHLSVCAQCREVVALSLPQLTEVTAQGHAAVPASFWSRLWTPGFRWAGAMAVIAVGAALVVELPRHQQGATQGPQSETKQTAQDAQQPKPAPAPEQPAVSGLMPAAADKATEEKTSASTLVAPPPVRSEARLQPPGFRDMQPAAAAFPAKKETVGRPIAEEAKSAGFVAGAGKQDYVANYLFAANDAKANAAFDYLPQAPAPQLTSQTGVAAGPPVHTPIFGGISGTPDTTINKKSKLLMPLAPLKHLACIFCKVADIGVGKTAPTSPGITSGAVMTSAMDLHGRVGSALLKDPPAMTAAAPEKSGSGGELDRSEIFARRAAAATASPRLREGASAQYHWKVEDGKLFKSLDQNQWDDAYSRADADFEFSFVTAHGADVWAGGSHAALLHSPDGGKIWNTVKLGDSASGKIVSIAASGLSVQVQTSTNQVWSSSDAGKTWVLQSAN